jgi:thymidylate synthase (FAD)
MSARYSEMPEEKWQPTEPVDVRGQGQGNKQVGNGQLDPMHQGVIHTDITEFNEASQAKYEELLALGTCREQARTVLPMGQYTEAYVTANLGDWLLFLKARLSPHAQLEIRLFAQAINNILVDLFPVTMEAFKDYQLEGVKFSAQEMAALKEMLQHRVEVETQDDMSVSIETPNQLHAWPKVLRKRFLSKHIETKRERQDFWKKIT